MFYQMVKPLAKVALRFFFKNIYWVDYEKVPKGKPVIFAANHPTAFIEPCVMACFADRPLYFLVRGDFFRKPLYAFLLKSLHMIPIFRKRDGGFGDLKNNLKTFSACSRALAEGKSLMILAEGCAENEKRLRPVQKGTGRLALSTLVEHGDLDLTVVPVGVNYSNALEWRSEVMINFGDPIPVKDYFSSYLENPASAVNQLTKDLETSLRKLVWHVEDARWDERVDQLIAMQRFSYGSDNQRFFSTNNQPYCQGYQTIKKWNQLDDELKNELSDSLEKYWNQLKRWMIRPQLDYTSKVSLGKLFLLVVLFPMAVLGFIVNFSQALMAKYICDRRVESETFYTPVLIAIGTGFNLILIVISVVVAIVSGQIWWLTMVPLIWLLGRVFLQWYDDYVHLKTQLLWQNIDDSIKADIRSSITPIKKLLTEGN